MTNIAPKDHQQLLKAIDEFTKLAKRLIHKVITETKQSQILLIQQGHYDEISNDDYFNDKIALSGNWVYEVHGTHCYFKHLNSHQALEVFLKDKESIGRLDPYFFYTFLLTTKKFSHLTLHFPQLFNDMLAWFEQLERETTLKHMGDNNFIKISIKKPHFNNKKG